MNSRSGDTGGERGITDEDRRQIRRYLRKHPMRRCVDDLRPAADGGDD